MKVRIAEVRNTMGVSQRELASRVGATLSMIGKLERGERQITFSWLQRIGDALDVPTGDLLDASEEPVYVGSVSAKGKITCEDYPPVFDPVDGEVQTFHVKSAESSKTCAITLSENTSVRMPEGARLIYNLPMQRADRELVGRLAVVQLAYQSPEPVRGQYVGYILAGSRPAHFHLMTLDGSLIQDVEVHLMALVREIDIPQRTDGA